MEYFFIIHAESHLRTSAIRGRGEAIFASLLANILSLSDLFSLFICREIRGSLIRLHSAGESEITS